jgi:16S rRNA (cytidine1402-2'-O)-methyltransferase
MSGTLYIVATPIGNLEDITLRALRVLKEVDLICCEDTRHTRKLLTHYGISTSTTSYHEHNESERATHLVTKLLDGADIALVSDAGTPLVSDPGFRLVREAINARLPVVPIPGPSAMTSALVASGMPVTEFTFVGFLPPKSSARRKRLIELSGNRSTLIIYEAPHRIKRTLADLVAIMSDRECVLARELTKVHEQFLRGSLSEVADKLDEGLAKGEMVLIVGPGLDNNRTGASAANVSEEVDQLVQTEGLDAKNALKRVARSRGISKSEAYRMMLAEKSGAPEKDRRHAR